MVLSWEWSIVENTNGLDGKLTIQHWFVTVCLSLSSFLLLFVSICVCVCGGTQRTKLNELKMTRRNWSNETRSNASNYVISITCSPYTPKIDASETNDGVKLSYFQQKHSAGAMQFYSTMVDSSSKHWLYIVYIYMKHAQHTHSHIQCNVTDEDWTHNFPLALTFDSFNLLHSHKQFRTNQFVH